MDKVVFIAKTDLNTDGRILNQLSILTDHFQDIFIDFVLLPDKDVILKFNDKIKIHPIVCTFRNNRILRVFTVLEWTLKAFCLLLKKKPRILHVQDSAVILPVLIYMIFRRSKTYIIYDDHELPNEGTPFFKRVWDSLENKLIKKSDSVIFANEERLKYLKAKLRPTNNLLYFLNLPFQGIKIKKTSYALDKKLQDKLSELTKEVSRGFRFMIHQGRLDKERGQALLAELSNRLPERVKILLVGGSESGFHSFVKEYRVRKTSFFFVGTVPYDVLPLFWDKAIASIVLYLPKYINNRLCAPNRLYLSYFKNLPVIVNKDNPVLSNFVQQYKAGTFIEDISKFNVLSCLDEFSNSTMIESKTEEHRLLLDREKSKITNLYAKAINKGS